MDEKDIRNFLADFCLLAGFSDSDHGPWRAKIEVEGADPAAYREISYQQPYITFTTNLGYGLLVSTTSLLLPRTLSDLMKKIVNLREDHCLELMQIKEEEIVAAKITHLAGGTVKPPALPN